MITTSDSPYFVQVGYVNASGIIAAPGAGYYPNANRYFYEIYDPYNDFIVFSATGPANGSSHNYNVTSDANKFYGLVDSTQIYLTTKNFTGTEAEFYAEINDVNKARYVGSSSNSTKFSNLKCTANGTVYNSPLSTSEFQAMGDVAGQSLSNWTNGNSSSYFTVWDTRN